jgi:GR25 family glycosyltransferase involved in LPS biosynthesis
MRTIRKEKMSIKTFCLCLPEYPDKMEKAKVHFAERGVENVEFFSSIHAEIAGLSTSHPYEIDHPASGFRVGYKITGIWLAHVVLWMHLARLPEDKFLILEDDAMFHEDWKERYEAALKHLPDFDFFHIGHCCLLGHEQTHIGGEVFATSHSQCTHAYILHRRCIPFLLRTVRKCYAPIDCQLVLEVFPHLKTFALIPRAVSQFC